MLGMKGCTSVEQRFERQQMSIRLRSEGLAKRFGGLVFFASVSLGTTACSGDAEPFAEASDEGSPPQAMPPALTDMNPSPNGPMEAAPAEDATEANEGPVTEGNPEVTELDDAEAPNAGEGAVADPEPAMPAAQMSMPVATLDVPNGAYCAAVADWDPEWVQFEEEVLLLVNENRSRAADCGVEGQFEAAAPIAMDPILRCSARLHSLDMFERDFFEHTNLDGLDPFQRMAAAGFSGSFLGENIALGQRTPEEVMEGWMESDGHCSNVMKAEFTVIGIGYHPGAGMRGLGSNYWTQNFGAPRAANAGGGGGRR